MGKSGGKEGGKVDGRRERRKERNVYRSMREGEGRKGLEGGFLERGRPSH